MNSESVYRERLTTIQAMRSLHDVDLASWEGEIQKTNTGTQVSDREIEVGVVFEKIQKVK